MFQFYRHLFSTKIIFGTTMGAAIFFMVIGVVYWWTFNTTMDATNSLEFCISCHEMENNVYQEYKKTVHYKNKSGVRTTCPDCHVPKEWNHKVIRKIQASNELFYKLIGSIDTAEKFEKKRLKLAKKVLEHMKKTDSIECRNCHSFDAMVFSQQKIKAGVLHKRAKTRGQTCIDCHKGIAHRLPKGAEVSRGGSDADHEYFEEQKLKCYQCHKDMPNPNDGW